MSDKTVPYPAIDLASSSEAIIFGSSSSLHYYNPSTSVSLSTPTVTPPTTNVAGSLLVRLVAISEDGRYAATISDDKSLRVYALPDTSPSSSTSSRPPELNLLSTRYLTKKASAISFTPSPNNDLLISDKVGDIYLYPLEARIIPEGTERPLPNSLASDPSLNPDATFLAGHVSIVTSHIFTPDQKCIITADRDEHIRISRYPKAYNIERFLFGSEGFVSAMHLVSSPSSNILISGGGESVLRIWDRQRGKQLHQVEIYDAVSPHRRVKSSMRKIKGEKKRPKVDDTGKKGQDDFYEPPAGWMLPAGQGVLIKKITSVEVEGETVVVFFSEGCAALHSFILPSDLTSPPVQIQTIPLAYPLINFTSTPSHPEKLLLSLDTAFGILSGNPSPTKTPKKEFNLDEKQVEVLKLSLREVTISSTGELHDTSSSSTLINPLQAILNQPTNLTTPDLRSTLPMYADLSLYPRWPGLEEDDDLAGPAPAATSKSTPTAGEHQQAGSAKSQGRKTGGPLPEEERPGEKIKKDYTREEPESMGLKQLGRLKAHGVDVADLLLRRKKDAKARGKEAKRRKLEAARGKEASEVAGGEGNMGEAEGDAGPDDEDLIANA